MADQRAANAGLLAGAGRAFVTRTHGNVSTQPIGERSTPPRVARSWPSHVETAQKYFDR